jgi:hypothetical protein
MIEIMNSTIILPGKIVVKSQTDGFQSWFSSSVQNSAQAAASSFFEGMNTDMGVMAMSKELAERIKKTVGDNGEATPEQIIEAIPREFNERSLKTLTAFMSRFVVDSTARSVPGANQEFFGVAMKLAYSYISLVAIPSGVFNFINDFLVVMARPSLEENGLDESLKIGYLSSKLTNVGNQVMSFISQGTVGNALAALSLNPNKVFTVTGQRAEELFSSQGGLFGILVACFAGLIRA